MLNIYIKLPSDINFNATIRAYVYPNTFPEFYSDRENVMWGHSIREKHQFTSTYWLNHNQQVHLKKYNL